MRLFSKKQKRPDMTLGRRRLERSDVAPPRPFSYHTARSQRIESTGRQLLRDSLNAEAASKVVKYWVRRFGLLVIIIVVTISLVNILSVSSNPEIQLQNPNQTDFLHDTSIYQQAASKLLSGSLANHNKITLNSAAIEASLKKQFPELDSVSIKVPLIGQRPIIYIEPTKPVLMLTTSDGQSYVVDGNGRVLSNVRDVTDVSSLKLVDVKNESSAMARVGQLALASDEVSFIQTILFQLDQKQLAVSGFTLPAGANELDMSLVGQSYQVKFNLADSSTAQQQVGTFLAVSERLKGEKITPSQYIDVRVDGRAYYK